MEIIHMRPEALRGYDRNARTHSDEQVAQIAASIREFGFNNPILVDETSTIIAGHGRLAAALRLGLDTVPVIVLAHLTPAQRRAYILADNKLAANAGWNKDLLRAELLELLPDMDLALLGFSTADLQDLLIDDAGPGLVDPDTLPQSADGVYSVEGDVWVLGGHRIMCGSSTSGEQVRVLLGGDCPRLMVTDPPYGVEYDAAWRGNAFKGRYASGIAVGKVLNDNIADWGDAWEHFPGDVAYVWHAGIMADIVAASLKKKGFSLRSQIIWAKSQLVIGRGNYHPMHEPCWYAVRSGRPGGFVGNRKQKTVWRDVADILRPGERVFVCPAENGRGVMALSGDETTVWDIPKPRKSETGHSTQKPVECMARPIRNNSKKGDFVYEPFSGSGTTIIAAHMLGRKCLAMELSPAYVDLAVRRWQNFTGSRAVHAATGREFPVGTEK